MHLPPCFSLPVGLGLGRRAVYKRAFHYPRVHPSSLAWLRCW